MAAGRLVPAQRTPALSPARRVLILAPHPDDEIVSCSVAALRARREGAQISAVFLTTGVPPREVLWPWQRARYEARVARRRDEAERTAALFQFGLGGFSDIPSRRLVSHLDEAAESIERAIDAVAATELWATAFEGAHQDHDAANALAASFRDRLPVWEFAAYNYAGGKVRSNRFLDARGGVVELTASRDEARLKREALALYASERGNLRHIQVREEAYRPLPRHDYSAPPHAGTLFRERFHWVPFRHPRIDFTPSTEIYPALGRWIADKISPPPGLTRGSTSLWVTGDTEDVDARIKSGQGH
ncbi:MAG TPA: PIG-L family deacetylase [Stellaceae bacterium]|nr:PIG-L family deacetylase [Stellaceae bacterium]